jgi:thiol-disulfide isomerase/thioredoxin
MSNKLTMRTTLLVGATLFLLASCTASTDSSNEAGSTDQTTPAIRATVNYADVLNNASFRDYEGNQVTLDQFKGKVVMIDFWETWCTPCLKAFPSMSKAMNDYPNDFVVLAVNLGESDQDSDVERFRNTNPDYPFVWVKDSELLANQLQVPGIPFKVFIAPDGSYHSHELGLSGSEDANYDKLVQLIQSQLQ